MSKIEVLVKRIWRIGGSVPGVLTLAATVITLAAPVVVDAMEDISGELGVDWSGPVALVVLWTARLAAWLTAAAQIYRRVMVVPEQVRSLDPVRNLVVAHKTPGTGEIREIPRP